MGLSLNSSLLASYYQSGPLEDLVEKCYSMRFESISHHDIDQLVKIDQECFDKSQTYDSNFFSKLLSGNQVSRKAMENDEIIGFVISVLSTRLALIYTLDVRPQHRRRGIASKLVDLLEEDLLERGCQEIVLQTRVNNTETIKLFMKRRYKRTDRISDYYSKGVDAYEMRKTL